MILSCWFLDARSRQCWVTTMAFNPMEPLLRWLERKHPLWESEPQAYRAQRSRHTKCLSQASTRLSQFIPCALGKQLSGGPSSGSSSSTGHISLSCWGRQRREFSGMNYSPSHPPSPPLSILNHLLSDITTASPAGPWWCDPAPQSWRFSGSVNKPCSAQEDSTHYSQAQVRKSKQPTPLTPLSHHCCKLASCPLIFTDTVWTMVWHLFTNLVAGIIFISLLPLWSFYPI